MSLVNDMLRDLDRRRGRDVPEGVRILSEDHDAYSGRKRILLVGAAILAVLVFLAVIGWLLTGRDQYQQQDVDSTPVAAQVAAQEEESETPDVGGDSDAAGGTVQAARLDLVSVRELADSFSLELRFTDDFRHRITNLNSHQLALAIDGVTLTDGFRPPVLAKSTEVQIAQTGEGVELKLNTDRAAEFDIEAMSGNRLNIDVAYVERGVDSRKTADVMPAAESGEADAKAPVVGEVPETIQSKTRPSETTQADETGQPQTDQTAQTGQENVETDTAVGQVRTTRELSLEERDAEVRQDALDLAGRGDIVEAYRLLRDFVAGNPAAHRSRETLVALLLTQEDPAQAQAVLEEGLSLAPSHPSFRRLQARLLIMAGETEEALSLLERSPPALAEDVAYHDLMASLLQELERHERAIAVFQDLLRHQPQEGRWWVAMGISLEALERYQEAMGSYQSALGMPELGEALRQYSRSRLETLRRR